MTRDEIRQRIETLLAEITDSDPIALSEASSPEEIPGWDSVNHIKLLFALEEELGISFPVDKMTLPDTVGALLDRIENPD